MSSYNKIAAKLNTWKRRQALATRRVNQLTNKLKQKVEENRRVAYKLREPKH